MLKSENLSPASANVTVIHSRVVEVASLLLFPAGAVNLGHTAGQDTRLPSLASVLPHAGSEPGREVVQQ